MQQLNSCVPKTQIQEADACDTSTFEHKLCCHLTDGCQEHHLFQSAFRLISVMKRLVRKTWTMHAGAEEFVFTQ